MADNEDTTTPDAPSVPDTGTADTPSEPHGDGGTDWKAEARKWEKRAKENTDAAARLAEFEDAQKTELEKAREEAAAAAAERDAAVAERLRLQVAAEKGLTPSQAKRLQGSSLEDLQADADELLAQFAPPTPDTPPGGRPKRLHNGNNPEPADGGFDPDALADQIARRHRY